MADIVPEQDEDDILTEEALCGMEKILIFDSIVVHKTALFEAYPVMESTGRMSWVDESSPRGCAAYMGCYGDLRYAALPQGAQNSVICRSYNFGGNWTEPTPIFKPHEEGVYATQNYPFVLSDGVTLYFAQESPDGFGGLDIYMTQRSGDDEYFYKPDNVGLPYNSEGNDYLLVIDEELGIGMFASDRRQHADSVCVYYFMPNTQRESYAEDIDVERRRSLARIERISDTWSIAPEKAQQLRERLSERRLQLIPKTGESSSSTQRKEMLRALQEMEDTLMKLRTQWHDGNHTDTLKELILDMEERVKSKRQEIKSSAE